MWNPDIGYCLLCVWNDLHQIKNYFNFLFFFNFILFYFLILFLFYKIKRHLHQIQRLFEFWNVQIKLFIFFTTTNIIFYSRLFAY